MNEKELEILETIQRCVKKARMYYRQIDVALDPDEDGDCYFRDGFFYIDDKKTKYSAADILSIKFKAIDYDDEDNYDDDVSYVKITFTDGRLYIYDYLICKPEYVYEYSLDVGEHYYGTEALKMLCKKE